jgi:hypothetical protein
VLRTHSTDLVRVSRFDAPMDEKRLLRSRITWTAVFSCERARCAKKELDNLQGNPRSAISSLSA